MIGESAGAIICAPSINISGKWMKSRRTTPKEDDAGLGLIDFYVLPHYLTAPFKESYRENND